MTTEIRSTLLRFGSWLLVLLAPVRGALIATLCLVVGDLLTGIWAARIRGERITSTKLRHTIVKALGYELAILFAFIGQTFMLPDIPIISIMAGFVVATELLSIYENLGTITGTDFLAVVKGIFNKKLPQSTVMAHATASVSTQDILSSDGKYPERAASATAAVIAEAGELAARVTALLRAYGGERPAINSGFRTPEANLAAKGALHSSHLEGKAVDLADPSRLLTGYILTSPAVLDEFNLWMEEPASTPTWCHLQSRPVAGKRIFKP
jgi:phage-related holin